MLTSVVLCFFIGYIIIVLEQPLKLDKSVPALLMGALTWALISVGNLEVLGVNHQVTPLEDGLLHIMGKTAEILFFLLGAMTIVELVDLHKGFSPITSLVKTKDKLTVLVTNLNTTEAEIKDKQFKISNLKSDLVNLKVGSEKGREVAMLEINAAFLQLKTNVSEWISLHLIISPSDGSVQVTNKFLKSGQYVNKDEPLLMVIPPQSNKMKGIMNIPFTESGNIRKNQTVLVRLNSYPSSKYGIIQGKVATSSSIALEDNKKLVTPVTVYFIKGLVTTTGYKVSTKKELSGTARIITQNKRFIQRLF